jgi:HAMP domain-containing protein
MAGMERTTRRWKLMIHIDDISWAKKLMAASSIYILGLLSVGVMGGYTIYANTKATEAALNASQTRVDIAVRAEVAILVMGREQAQLLSASNSDERRAAAIAAITASSALDESIQRLQEALTGNSKVAQLSQLLREIGPAKMQVIKAVRSNDEATARSTVASMQQGMAAVERLSQDLAKEQQDNLTTVVSDQKKEGTSTIEVLAGLVVCGITASLLASWFAGKLMAGPLAVLEQSARSLATGDLTIQVPQFGGDEIGRTATAMGSMVHDLHVMVTNIHHNGRSVSTQASSVASSADSLQTIFANLHDAVEHIRGDAAIVLSTTSRACEEISSMVPVMARIVSTFFINSWLAARSGRDRGYRRQGGGFV